MEVWCLHEENKEIRPQIHVFNCWGLSVHLELYTYIHINPKPVKEIY